MKEFDKILLATLTSDWQSTPCIAKQILSESLSAYDYLKTRRHLTSLKKYGLIEQ